MTQRLGDEEAMRILRVHDQIVRREIEMQRGHVIKHTGDGFMAAFPSASGAVRSAISILKSLQMHNQRSLTVPFEFGSVSVPESRSTMVRISSAPPCKSLAGCATRHRWKASG